jgi:tRNA threonylcarbamoyladenosine biosynthesis protein TsaE
VRKGKTRQTRTPGPSRPPRLHWISRSPEETRARGERIGRLLTGGELIALEGNLGAGKTQFIQGLARGLEITNIPVTSPTFVFVHEFRGRRPFAHVDLFRIEHEEDLPDLGILEYLDSPWVVAIEWADKAGSFLPAERLNVRMTNLGETDRKIDIEAVGAGARRILHALKRSRGRQRI